MVCSSSYGRHCKIPLDDEREAGSTKIASNPMIISVSVCWCGPARGAPFFFDVRNKI